MAEVLKFPFRFSNGRVQKVTKDSNEHGAQVIASIVQTGRGELPVTPDFGTLSPEFASFDASGLYFTLAGYFPQLTVNNVQQEINPETGVVELKIQFSNSAD